MINKKERINYWDKKYVEYWKARTEEAEKVNYSQMVRGDTKTTDMAVYAGLIDELKIQKKDVVLELGCGFGRSFSYLLTKSENIYGVDISIAMIEAAKRNFNTKVKGLFVAEAETLPFRDNVFTKIICFTVFDALYQKESLIEMNRKLKMGGKILLTGKNDNYHIDDEMALVAEKNARKKGHPNYFTDVKLLLQNLDVFGFELLKIYCYERRGDFPNNSPMQIENQGMDKFYEYCLFLKKIKNIAEKNNNIDIYSDKSKTFLKLEAHL